MNLEPSEYCEPLWAAVSQFPGNTNVMAQHIFHNFQCNWDDEDSDSEVGQTNNDLVWKKQSLRQMEIFCLASTK